MLSGSFTLSPPSLPPPTSFLRGGPVKMICNSKFHFSQLTTPVRVTSVPGDSGGSQASAAGELSKARSCSSFVFSRDAKLCSNEAVTEEPLGRDFIQIKVLLNPSFKQSLRCPGFPFQTFPSLPSSPPFSAFLFFLSFS